MTGSEGKLVLLERHGGRCFLPGEVGTDADALELGVQPMTPFTALHQPDLVATSVGLHGRVIPSAEVGSPSGTWLCSPGLTQLRLGQR